MKQIRTHLTYANVMSSLAVFLLLGGASAYAAKKQTNKHQTKKIGTTQIKASAVTTAKIKNRAVDTSKLRDAAVTAAKLGVGAVGAASLADGSVGTAKLAGDAVTGDKVNESTLSEVPSANSANPVVFARVNLGGGVDAGNSKGLNSPNVAHPVKGVYCLSVPAFVPRGGQVSVHGTSEPAIAQLAVGGTASCPYPAVQVSTWTLKATPEAALAPVDAPFYVELYR
ncbi:MAG: hypothetical protein WA862_08925 [Solirubrobacterales bacterium]